MKKDLLESIVLKALQETLTGKNLSVIVDEIYKQHNAKLLGDNPVKALEKELLRINKSINNIMNAIEQGIITDTTKDGPVLFATEISTSACAFVTVPLR